MQTKNLLKQKFLLFMSLFFITGQIWAQDFNSTGSKKRLLENYGSLTRKSNAHNQVLNDSYSTVNDEFCVSYVSPSGNYTWTTPGIYTDTIPNHLGFDSIITINLTKNNNLNITPTVNGTVISANYPGATYQWYNCDYQLPINSQTSSAFQAKFTGNYAVIVNDNGCVDTSLCVNVNVVVNPTNITANPDLIDYFDFEANLNGFKGNQFSSFGTPSYDNGSGANCYGESSTFFDNSNAIYCNMPTFPKSGSPFSVSFWVKRQINANHSLFNIGNATVGNCFTILQEGALLKVIDGSNNEVNTMGLPVGTWNHITVTFSGNGTDNIKIYKNGVLASFGTLNISDINTDLVRIGRNQYNQSLGNFYMDKLSIYSRVLDGNEVAGLHQNRCGTPKFVVSPIVVDKNVCGSLYTSLSGDYTFTQNGSYTDAVGSTLYTINLNLNAPLTIKNVLKRPIHHYKLDGDANDAIGNNNGTFASTPQFVADRFNRPNSAYSSMPSNFVDLASAVGNPTGSQTITLWFRPTNSFVFSTFFSRVSNTAGHGPLCMDSNGRLGYYNSSTQAVGFSGANNQLTLNNWHHLAYVRNGTFISIYLNGVLVVTGGDGVTDPIKELFRNTASAPQTPRGNIDDLKFYDYALSASEILSAYNAELNSPQDYSTQVVNVCEGTSANLSAMGNVTNWYYNGNVISGTTANSLLVNPVNNTTAGVYLAGAYFNDGCKFEYIDSFKVNSLEIPNVVIEQQNDDIVVNNANAQYSYSLINCADNSIVDTVNNTSNVVFSNLVNGNSYAVVGANGQCRDTSACLTFSSTVGVKAALNGRVELMPNPAKDNVTIKGLDKNAKVEIIDVIGKVHALAVADKAELNINTAGFISGIYFARITHASGETKTLRFAIE